MSTILTGTLYTRSPGTPLASTSVEFTPLVYPTTLERGTFSGSNYYATTDINGAFEIELYAGSWRVQWLARGFRNTVTITVPEEGGDLRDLVEETQNETATKLIAWVIAEAFVMSESRYDGNGILTTATVTWPDGEPGTITTREPNVEFLSYDAFSVTYLHRGVTTTINQGTVTRDDDGYIVSKPLPTAS